MRYFYRITGTASNPILSNRFTWWLSGWASLLDGLVVVLSLGYISSPLVRLMFKRLIGF